MCGGSSCVVKEGKRNEIRREIRTLQSPDKGGGGRHGEKRESRAERKYGGCFVGCELVEGKVGLIGGEWGLSAVDLHSDRGRIRRQTLPARSAGEGMRRRKCRRRDRRPDREERRGVPGRLVLPR